MSNHSKSHRRLPIFDFYRHQLSILSCRPTVFENIIMQYGSKFTGQTKMAEFDHFKVIDYLINFIFSIEMAPPLTHQTASFEIY